MTKKYDVGNAAITALDHVGISFVAGEFTAIMGPSGSGKPTLMYCMADLDSAASGGAYIGTTELSKLSDKGITALRCDHLGFVFQPFNLVSTLTAAENTTLPINVADRKMDKQWFEKITTRLGLKERFTHRPSELSGGQQQRVACACAIVNRPEIIFGDEPADNLGSNSSRGVLAILRDVVNDIGQTVVIVTRDTIAVLYANRVVFLTNDHVVDELRNPMPTDILARMVDIENL